MSLLSRLPRVLVLGLLGVPVSLSAQTRIDIGPSVGLYLPLRSYVGPGSSFFPPFSESSEWTQRNALAVGAHAAMWLGRRWGVAASYNYAGSDVSNPAAGGMPGGRLDGSVQVLTAELQARLGNTDRPFQLVFTGGAAYITRSGDAFAQVDGHDAVGAVLGLASRRELGSRWVATGSVRVLIYSLELRDEAMTYEASTQADMLGQVTIAYRVF